MYKPIILGLLACCLLVGCKQESNSISHISSTTQPPATQTPTTEPVTTLPKATDTATSETEDSAPAVVTTVVTEETIPETTEETEVEATEAPTTQPPETAPVTETAIQVSEPTLPPQEATTTECTETPEETESLTVAVLDCELAMSVGNQYGSDTYGWTVDLSLNETNAGFNFGSLVFADEGQDQLNSAGKGQIDFLYNELQTRYPDQDISGIRFCVHAFLCGDGLYEVRVYYA